MQRAALHRAAPLVPVLLLSALALTACGHQSEPPSAGARPTSSDDPGFLPLAAYDMTDGDGRTVARARWTLAKECMARLGFGSLKDLALDPLPTWPRRPAGTGVVTLTMYSSDTLRSGVQNPEQAARYGYQGARVEYERRSVEKKWTLPEYLALTGQFVGDDPKSVHGHRIPERGCLGEADRSIYGSNPADRKDLVLDLKARSLRNGRKDPAWKEADQVWSGCMRAAG